MGSSIKEDVLKTLLYGDIFDYPLLKEEVWKFLISSKKHDKQKVFDFLNLKTSVFAKRKNYFFIKGRENLISTRDKREKYSLKKIELAKKIILKLSKIPSVYFIGISGALAMKNSEESDDIDLFVITSKRSVWTTRLIMVIYLKAIKAYRTKNEKNPSNKICLNMLIDETALSFLKNRQDLYSAHEISQIMPIFNRNKTYEKFIAANYWVKNFLPNVFEEKNKSQFIAKNSLLEYLMTFVINIFFIEFLVRKIQFLYMKKNITEETVLKNFLAFHPFNYKKFVLEEYRKRSGKTDIVITTRGY